MIGPMIADAAQHANQFSVCPISPPENSSLYGWEGFFWHLGMRVRSLIPSATWGERIMQFLLAIATVMAIGAALIYRAESRRED
jgi:hypothetical protein